MASLRSLAISLQRLDGHANIAAANRHHARDPQRTLTLLQTARTTLPDPCVGDGLSSMFRVDKQADGSARGLLR
jgi:hypothetical protein